MNKSCWKCRQEISENVNYCPYCGSRQNEFPFVPRKTAPIWIIGGALFAVFALLMITAMLLVSLIMC